MSTIPVPDRSCCAAGRAGSFGMPLLKRALAVVAAVVAASAWAAGSPMPPEIAKKLVELGRVIDPPATAKLYAPLQPKEPYFGVRVERDLKYGPAERNLL